MGTTGTITIMYHGKKIMLYNHFDSYLTALGVELINDLLMLLQQYSLDELKNMFDSIKMVDVFSKANLNEAEIMKLKKYTDLSVSTQSLDNWYCVLYHTQGSLIKLLDAGYGIKTYDSELFNYYLNLDEKYFQCIDYHGKETLFHSELTLIDLKNTKLAIIASDN